MRETITCQKCGEEKEPQDFYRNHKSGCIECLKEYYRAAYYIKQGREVPPKRIRQIPEFVKLVKREIEVSLEIKCIVEVDAVYYQGLRSLVEGATSLQVHDNGVCLRSAGILDGLARETLADKINEALNPPVVMFGVIEPSQVISFTLT